MTTDQKYKLFSEFSKNLEIVTGVKGLFVCPFCKQSFSLNQLDELTIEHVIPQKLGGNIKILTCKKCNNDLGSKFHSKLVKFMNIVESENLDVDLKIADSVVKSNLSLSPKIIQFDIDESRSNPANISAIFEKYSSNSIGEFSFSLKLGSIKNQSKLGVLLISYYLLFSFFGYFFIFNESGYFIENIIKKNKISEILAKYLVYDKPIIPNQRLLVCPCDSPVELLDYLLIQIPIITPSGRTKFLIQLLPWKFDYLKGYEYLINNSSPYLRISKYINYSSELKNIVYVKN